MLKQKEEIKKLKEIFTGGNQLDQNLIILGNHYFEAAKLETDDKAKQKNLYIQAGDAYTKAENLAETDKEKAEIHKLAQTHTMQQEKL